ncbi:MAG: DUF983 domain-containing protein [Parvularcula sp.]|nr:DUF983 domain-containing protein [Parvularcula sp.]
MSEHRIADPGKAAMNGRCPRCGQGHIFDGYLKLKPHCAVCGLDLAFADSGDGPAFFVMSITGLITVVAAFIVRFVFNAPVAAALLIAVLIAVAVTFAVLRPAKGLLIGLQYKNDAAEGRLG